MIPVAIPVDCDQVVRPRHGHAVGRTEFLYGDSGVAMLAVSAEYVHRGVLVVNSISIELESNM